MKTKEQWIDEVRLVLDEDGGMDIKDYRDGLQEILEDVYTRYECAEVDVGNADRSDEEE